MTLPQEMIDQIVKRSREYAGDGGNKKSVLERIAYQSGAMAEATRAATLVTFINKFISRHEAGLLPDRFLYEEGVNVLKSYKDGK